MNFGKSKLKRFVYVSSVVGEILGQRDLATFKKIITEDDVGSLPLDVARTSKDPFTCYVAAKIESESYLLSVAKTDRVPWDAVITCPTGVCGPTTHPVKFGQCSHSLDWAHGFMSGEWQTIPPVPLYNIVDVRDVALANILALTEVKASNERINISNTESLYTHQVLANTIHKMYPELANVFPVGTPDKLLLDGMESFVISNTKSKAIFGDALVYRHEEETIGDYVSDMWAWMKKLNLLPKGIQS